MIIHTLKILIEYEDADVISSLSLVIPTYIATQNLN